MLGSIWRHRGLILAMVRREVSGRYRGSLLGIFWSLVQPLLMLTVYTFVFSVVFKARWRSGSDSQTEFALVLFAGLIVFNLFAECMNRAPGLVLSQPNFVKKVVFPLEIVPVISLGAALFHAGMSLIVWLVAYVFFWGLPHPTVLLFPVVLFSLACFVLGVSWVLASLGVYVRDVAQLVGMVTTVLMFLSPIFFPVDALPARFQPLFLLNPLTPAIEQARDLLFWGRIPNPWAMLSFLSVGVAVAWAGFAWFQKTRDGFADVL
jgi:lipopolysaccharide transport system permease protein